MTNQEAELFWGGWKGEGSELAAGQEEDSRGDSGTDQGTVGEEALMEQQSGKRFLMWQ